MEIVSTTWSSEKQFVTARKIYVSAEEFDLFIGMVLTGGLVLPVGYEAEVNHIQMQIFETILVRLFHLEELFAVVEKNIVEF